MCTFIDLFYRFKYGKIYNIYTQFNKYIIGLERTYANILFMDLIYIYFNKYIIGLKVHMQIYFVY